MINAVSFLNQKIQDPYALKEMQGIDGTAASGSTDEASGANENNFNMLQDVQDSSDANQEEDPVIVDTALDMDSLDEMLRKQQEEQII